MGIFDDDPFESIFDEFFGNSRARRRKQQFIKSEEEDRTSDFIEDNGKIFLIFEVKGYKEKDIMITAKNARLEIAAQKTNLEEVAPYLQQKMKQGLTITKELPDFVEAKKWITQ